VKASIRLLDRLVVAAAWIAGLMTVFMMVQITADVIGRTIFNHPIAGTIEIVSAYCMTALAFLPLALIARERGHIIVEVFTGRMPLRWRTLLDGFVAIVTLVYTAVFTWKAIEIAITKTGIREAKEAGIGFVEIWPARWVVAVGFGLMALCVLVQMCRDIRAGLTGDPGPDADGRARNIEGRP
jgi:TRAP-type C4-dicarboxylate transport system permease small subunit